VLTGLRRKPNAPALIVTSERVDDRLWAEVLNLGGYDVLMKPLDSTEVGHVINLAWMNWQRARENAVSDFAIAAGM
jgi:DNA-binding response OmpR family regulator